MYDAGRAAGRGLIAVATRAPAASEVSAGSVATRAEPARKSYVPTFRDREWARLTWEGMLETWSKATHEGHMALESTSVHQGPISRFLSRGPGVGRGGGGAHKRPCHQRCDHDSGVGSRGVGFHSRRQAGV